MNYSECSNGKLVTQATIDKNLSQSYREKYWNVTKVICECCGKEMSRDSDHTIAQARCKEIRKTELIWNPFNYVRSCQKCHREWESYKSGDWLFHLNVVSRLAFLELHDPEGFRLRIELTELALTEHGIHV